MSSQQSKKSINSQPTPTKVKLATGLSKQQKSAKGLKVYGNSKSDNSSSINLPITDPIPSTPGSSGTQISVILEGKQKEVNLTQKLKENLIYAIVLPLIICEDEKLIQPILLKLEKSNFDEYEIDLPFSAFMDMKMNCFKFKLDKYSFLGRIMALGDSPLELKVCMQENSTINSAWKGLPKTKRINSEVTQFIHVPLEDEEDIPSYRVLKRSDIEDLFSNKGQASVCIDKSSKIKKDRQLFSGQKRMSPLLSETPEEDPEQIKRKKVECKNIMNVPDQTVIEKSLETIGNQLIELNAKKSFLSNLDTTGSVLITMINVLDDLYKIIENKRQNEIDFSMHVPETDDTYKISTKNQIFIEGSIQLDLDLYEAATKQAKPGNPSSFAYCFVKFSFPNVYVQDVVLGKKLYDKKDFHELVKAKNSGSKVKYPLAFIWGFQDPFNARLEGDCDHKLGHERVRAFLNHIFRKAQVFTYSKELERDVRRRLMKELCSLNYSISKQNDQTSTEGKDDESSEDDENSCQVFAHDIFDDDEFEN